MESASRDKGRAGPEGGRNRARPGGRVGRGPACRRAGALNAGPPERVGHKDDGGTQ